MHVALNLIIRYLREAKCHFWGARVHDVAQSLTECTHSYTFMIHALSLLLLLKPPGLTRAASGHVFMGRREGETMASPAL